MSARLRGANSLRGPLVGLAAGLGLLLVAILLLVLEPHLSRVQPVWWGWRWVRPSRYQYPPDGPAAQLARLSGWYPYFTSLDLGPVEFRAWNPRLRARWFSQSGEVPHAHR